MKPDELRTIGKDPVDYLKEILSYTLTQMQDLIPEMDKHDLETVREFVEAVSEELVKCETKLQSAEIL